MLRTTVIGARAFATYLATVVAAMAVAGSAVAAKSTPVPESFTLPEDSRRFDGSVAVNVTIDVRSLRLVRPKQITSLEEFSAWLGVPAEEMALLLGGEGLVFPAVEVTVPEAPRLVYGPGRDSYLSYIWSLSVPADVFGTVPTTVIASAPPQYAVQWSRENTFLIKDAVQRSLVASGLFPRIATGPADYRVDVWIEGYEPTTPTMGMGAFLADVLSIWRLTRTSDGAVLACDFADGHGSWQKAGFGPSTRAFHVALQDMIGKGLVHFADRSREHLAALEPACLGRVGADGQLPAAAGEWRERVRRNWPQLHAGMSVDEVVATIGPVRIANERLDRTYVVPVFTSEFMNKLVKGKSFFAKTDPTMDGLGAFELVEYRTDLYTLWFVSKRMTRWHADVQENQIERVSPPGLVNWQLHEK